MSRKPCCTGEGLKKGAWTAEEDKKLISYIHDHGEGGWRDIPAKAGLKRCGKSCRLRWTNYLKPEIKRGEFSFEEEQIIIMLHASRGNKWSVIARHLPRRTDNEIKNYWNTHLKKRLIDQGIDPVTHKPLDSSNPATPNESSDTQNAPSSESRDYSRSSSMSSLSRPPSLEIMTNDEMSIQKGFLSCKKHFGKSNSTSRLLNKVASKATSMKGILSASMEGSLTSSTLSNVSFNGDISKHISNEEDDNSNVSMTNFDEYPPFFQSTLYPEHEINASPDNFGMNGEFDDLSHILEKLGHEDNNTNVGYGHDFLMSDVSSTSVDDQENMIENNNGWSKYLLDNTEFIYEADSDSLEKHFI